MTYLVPKIRLNGHYTAKGHVLLLKLDTSGEMFMEIRKQKIKKKLKFTKKIIIHNFANAKNTFSLKT